jgi:branched-chain amino acid transport system ATP-binding protein
VRARLGLLRPGERTQTEPGVGVHAESDVLLAVDELSCSYGGIRALEDVSLRVGPGEAVCIVGANGAGKTTLAKTIAGLVRPDAGRVVFDGQAIEGMRASKVPALGVAIVLEGRHVFVDQSVRTNLELGAYWRRLSRDRLLDELELVYSLFDDLRAVEHKRAGALSGGQQQMLCVGRALMGAPRLLVLDEPSMGLSPKLAGALYESMGRLREGGLTIVLIEQNAELAFRFCNRGYLLQQGRIVVGGPVEDLRATDLVRRIYLGDDATPPATGASAQEEEAR